MNKPVAFLCACIALPGFIILGSSIYFTTVYGHGDLEAGNFHRCLYSVERDAVSGNTRRSYDTRWDLVSSTEGSQIAEVLSMLVVGIILLLVAGTIYVADAW